MCRWWKPLTPASINFFTAEERKKFSQKLAQQKKQNMTSGSGTHE